jgi:hypothetical protein
MDANFGFIVLACGVWAWIVIELLGAPSEDDDYDF